MTAKKCNKMKNAGREDMEDLQARAWIRIREYCLSVQVVMIAPVTYRLEHEKIKIKIRIHSGHAIFFLLYRHINEYPRHRFLEQIFYSLSWQFPPFESNYLH